MKLRKTYVADYTSDSVTSKDIQTVIISEDELELCGKVANGASKEPIRHSCRAADRSERG